MKLGLVTLRNVVQVIALYCLQSSIASCTRFSFFCFRGCKEWTVRSRSLRFSTALDLYMRNMRMQNVSTTFGQTSRTTFSQQKEAKVSCKYIHAMFWNVVLEKIRWIHRMRNEEVLYSQGGEKYPTYNNKRRRLTGLVTSSIGTAF